MYSVKEVSEISGVTIKTLHYYHKIGILSPSAVGDNNYRYYEDKQIDRLQVILFYRALEIPLKEIGILLEEPQSRLEVLKSQRDLLLQKKEKLTDILKTIDSSIIEEEQIMENKDVDKVKHTDKFKGLEEVSSLESVLQNYTVIMTKPMYIQYLIIGVVLLIGSSMILFTGKIDELVNAPTDANWLSSLPKEGIIVAVVAFFLLGVITTAISIKVLFFTKTKDLLEEVNRGKGSKRKK